MSRPTISVIPISAAAVRQVCADTDDLASVVHEGGEAGHTWSPQKRAREHGAHRAARLASPAGTVEDRYWEFLRLGRIESRLIEAIGADPGCGPAQILHCSAHLLVGQLRDDLCGKRLEYLDLEPTAEPLGVYGFRAHRTDDADTAIQLRCGGATYSSIARHTGLEDPELVEEMVRWRLGERINRLAAHYRPIAVHDWTRDASHFGTR